MTWMTRSSSLTSTESPRRTQAAKVVDDIPDLPVRNAAIESRHHTRRKPVLDDTEDVGISRTVIPLRVGEIGRLLPVLLLDDRDRDAGFHRALRAVTVTSRAIGGVDSLPGGD